MDRTLQTIFNGAFALVRGPLLVLLLASIVISLVRHSRARLAPNRFAPARVRKQLPRA